MPLQRPLDPLCRDFSFFFANRLIICIENEFAVNRRDSVLGDLSAHDFSLRLPNKSISATSYS
jgi:hypothetical protein